MIEFANPALLGALAAAGAPLLAHLAARRRLPRLDWGAMRFLAQVLARHRRRLALQHWLLMGLRMLALACLALALARPRLAAPDAAPAAALRPPGAAVAAVLCLDDSPSAAAEGAWERMRALARAYLATLRPGDEVGLVLGSQAGAEPADPLYDLAAVAARIDALRPSDAASDIPALVAAGRRQFARHLNPRRELVLVSDGRDDGWPAPADARWAAARPRPGAAGEPALLLLAPPAGAVDDLAVAALECDRDPVPAGRPVGLRVRVANPGARAVEGAVLRLAVDGRVVGERTLAVPAGGEVQVTLRAQFAEPGAHVAEAVLAGQRDALPADDRRALALEAVAALPVLLVSDPGPAGLAAPLGLVEAALDPRGDGGSFFAVRRAAPAELAARPDLAAAQRVVVLGGVRALEPAALAALGRALAGGTGLLVCAGPELPAAAAAGPWWQGGDGILAAPPGARAGWQGRRIARIDAAHPALGAFLGTDLAAAFPGGELRSGWTLPRPGQGGAGADLAVLAELDDGAPLCVLRRRGAQRSALVACALDGRDGELPLRPAFVPFIRGLAGWLGAALVPPRNLEAGAALAWLPPGGGACDPRAATLDGPDGPLALALGAWEGRAALVSPPLARAGAYVLRPAGAPPVRYAVGTAAGESRLRPLAPGAAAAALAPAPLAEARDPAQVAALAAPGAGPQARELWRALVLAALALLAAELAVSRALARREQAAEAAA